MGVNSIFRQQLCVLKHCVCVNDATGFRGCLIRNKYVKYACVHLSDKSFTSVTSSNVIHVSESYEPTVTQRVTFQ